MPHQPLYLVGHSHGQLRKSELAINLHNNQVYSLKTDLLHHCRTLNLHQMTWLTLHPHTAGVSNERQRVPGESRKVVQEGCSCVNRSSVSSPPLSPYFMSPRRLKYGDNREGRGQLEHHLSLDHMCLYDTVLVHQMDQKMDSVLQILSEQFLPKPELTSKPSIRRAKKYWGCPKISTVQRRERGEEGGRDVPEGRQAGVKEKGGGEAGEGQQEHK
ncbi:hypothetical protein PAMP_020027 [Pampus punctatissimus]